MSLESFFVKGERPDEEIEQEPLTLKEKNKTCDSCYIGGCCKVKRTLIRLKMSTSWIHNLLLSLENTTVFILVISCLFVLVIHHTSKAGP